MLSQIPVDVLENRIFYYLGGQDIYNLSVLNQKMRDRLSPIRTLMKFGMKPHSIWPRLQFDFRGEFTKKFRMEDPDALESNSSEIQLLLPELLKIKWVFPEISINSQSFPLIHKYIPKAQIVFVQVIEQDNYVAFGNALCSNIVTELFIGAMDTIKDEQVFHILSNLPKMTKLKKVTQSYELDGNFALAYQRYLPGSCIENLDLENNAIDDSFVHILATVLPETKIKSLSLHWNSITDDGVEALAAVLPHTQIEFLELGRNQIGGDGIKALAKVLARCRIKTLHLTENELSAEDMDELFKVIHLSNLERFIFYDSVTEDGVKMLIENLPKSKLKELTLEIPPNLIGNLLKAASNSPLQELYPRTNQGDEMCNEIFKHVEYLTIEKLNMGYSMMTPVGFQKLLSCLAKTELKVLDVHDNAIGNKGLELLSEYLPHTRIEKLILNRCGFDSEGVLALAKCLKKTKLVHLEMRCYETSGPAVSTFIDSLNSSMRYLDISWSKTIDREACGKVVSKYPHMKIIY
ncbi:hypothetical protein HDV06_001527 [Boothiomyces sp. JEL0866]|nr:hypothetical protein HDV06_001522 [Boothiomyces sp. JEL0866]KAJ3317503.1 hypothetical protein HDV06_001527 [Boothiomyces sp. JEL0866]